MKLLTLTASLIVLSLHGFGQLSPYVDTGDSHFDKLEFREAIKYYEMALDEDAGSAVITRRIATAYEQLGEIKECAYWLEKTIMSQDSKPEDMLDLAEALKRLERYETAIRWYGKFAEVNPDDKRAQSHLKDPYYYQELHGDSAKYRLKRLAFNSGQPAFGVCQFGSEYLFSASGVDGEFADKSEEDRNPFLDIYSCSQDSENEFVEIKRLEGAVNSKYHDGPVFFDDHEQVMYITRNNIKNNKPVLDEQGKINLKIYTSQLENGVWQKAEEMPFNSDEFSNGHPCLTPDGKRLYFVSNRPGGFGGTDLYVCTRFGDKWTEPQNLGESVNTEGDEMFPQIDEDGTLFFASSGHAGLGGLDLFKSAKKGILFGEPQNLGYPISSPHDDFSLFYESGISNGFFASNRDGQGNDNIYFFSTHDSPMQILAGFIHSVEGQSLAGQKLAVTNHTTGETTFSFVGEDNAFEIEVLAGHSVSVSMESNNYVEDPIFNYECPNPVTDPYANLGEFTIHEKRFASIPGIQDAQPWTLNKDVLAARHAEEEKLRAELAALKEQVDELVRDQPTFDMKVTEDKSILTFDFDSDQKQLMYFRFNSSVVTKEAAPILDTLAGFLKAHPQANININTHCDSRGDQEYNMVLSEDRARAVRKYLVWKGVAKRQIDMDWFGETKLANHCDDHTACDSDDHRKNRRAVLTISGDMSSLQ